VLNSAIAPIRRGPRRLPYIQLPREMRNCNAAPRERSFSVGYLTRRTIRYFCARFSRPATMPRVNPSSPTNMTWPCSGCDRIRSMLEISTRLSSTIMLLDWTGRELHAEKRGAIPDHLAPIVDRLGINRSNWVETVRGFGRLFKQAAGRSSSLVDAAARRSRRWFQGKAAARTAFM
jgi:hypothetical protein